MSFKIGDPRGQNTHTETVTPVDYSLPQSPLQSKIPQFGFGLDPFKVAEQRRSWWAFLDNFLLPIVEKEMVKNRPTFKDHPMLSMLAAESARKLRASAGYSEIGGTLTAEELADIKQRFPQAMALVNHATGLSLAGKTQEEILKALQAATSE